jgi:hypothetical protein
VLVTGAGRPDALATDLEDDTPLEHLEIEGLPPAGV